MKVFGGALLPSTRRLTRYEKLLIGGKPSSYLRLRFESAGGAHELDVRVHNAEHVTFREQHRAVQQ